MYKGTWSIQTTLSVSIAVISAFFFLLFFHNMNIISYVLIILSLISLTRAQVNCSRGDVQIVNGVFTTVNSTLSVSGEVQVCVISKWVAVCSSGWDRASAVVACRQLGISYSGKTIENILSIY